MRKLSYLWSNIRSRTVVLLLALVGVALIAAACGGGEQSAATPAQKVTIKMWDGQWESQSILNAIGKLIIEEAYGYPVEEIIADTPVAQVALARGDMNVWMEMNPPNYIDWFREETAKGTIVDLKGGPILEGQPQFFLVPKWVAEQYDIKTVEDMKRPEVVKLFPDPEDPKKGAFINCKIGWQCAAINEAKFRAYGLDKYYNIISPGSAAAEEAAMAGPMKKRQPVFGYWWSPHALMAKYDWYILEEPPFTQACWDDIVKGRDDRNFTPKQACAYETAPVTVTVHKSLVEQAPDLVELLNKMSVGEKALNQTAAWAIQEDIQGKWEKAAVYYLKTFEGRWTTWMPADKVQKVKEALDKAN